MEKESLHIFLFFPQNESIYPPRNIIKKKIHNFVPRCPLDNCEDVMKGKLSGSGLICFKMKFVYVILPFLLSWESSVVIKCNNCSVIVHSPEVVFFYN